MYTGHDGTLELDKLPIKVDVYNVDKLSNDDYIMARRNGFGSSDSSVLLGVNPYQKIPELIRSKLLTYVTPEERAVGDKTAVKKGRDLEPLVMDKASAVLQVDLIKPIHMYRFKEQPQLTINFDGVTDTPKQYIPVEIKIVTKAGERHYNTANAIYKEHIGVLETPPPKPNLHALTTEQKAAYYGIPPYYYTQLNQEMFGLNAPYGYLAVLFETTWELVIYYIYRDDYLLDQLVTVSKYHWDRIEEAKNSDI